MSESQGQAILSEAAHYDAARLLLRGVARMFKDYGYHGITEFRLANQRRADFCAIGKRGKIIIVELKRSVADLRSDEKWPFYRDYCDEFYFAVPEGFALDAVPDDQGLVLCDRFGAEIVRAAAPPIKTLHASRRREVLLRFARTAAARLADYTNTTV